MRRANLAGGIVLILFGLVFLAGNLGFVDHGYFYRLGQLWPLWLVVAGLILVSRSFPAARIMAGLVVVGMLILAVVDPVFLDSFRGYRYWHHSWGVNSLWGLLFLVGAVWVLYTLFGRDQNRATE
jgi:hypothetical protein